MKRYSSFFIFLMLLSVITGCWDRQLLKDVSLNMLVGFDLSKDHELETTVSIPINKDGKEGSILTTVVGKTTRDTRIKIDERTPQTLNVSKNTLVLISEELAKQDIYNILDVFYRDPKNALNAHLAIVEGKTVDIISQSKKNSSQYNKNPSEYLNHIILNAEQTSRVSRNNLQTISTLMYDSGTDFMLPLLAKKTSTIKIEGMAMFDNKKMTGKLNSKESTMYLLLKGDKNKISRLTQKIYNNKNKLENHISFEIDDVKQKMNIYTSENNNVIIEIHLKLDLIVTEYPLHNLNEENKLKQLEKILSKDLENLANIVIQKMQEANCDALGIKRRLIAFHNDEWNEIKEDTNYQNFKINPSIDINIIDYGIIN